MRKLGRKRPGSKSRPGAAPAPAPSEDRAALVVTVLWMLTLLSTLAATLAAAAALAIVRLRPEGPPEPDAPALAAMTLLPAATIMGLCCLALTPLVWRWREVKPPRAIIIASLLGGAAPLALWLVLRLLG